MTSGTKVGGHQAANPDAVTPSVPKGTVTRPGRHRSKKGLAAAGIGLIGLAGIARRLRRRKTGSA